MDGLSRIDGRQDRWTDFWVHFSKAIVYLKTFEYFASRLLPSPHGGGGLSLERRRPWVQTRWRFLQPSRCCSKRRLMKIYTVGEKLGYCENLSNTLWTTSRCFKVESQEQNVWILEPPPKFEAEVKTQEYLSSGRILFGRVKLFVKQKNTFLSVCVQGN